MSIARECLMRCPPTFFKFYILVHILSLHSPRFHPTQKLLPFRKSSQPLASNCIHPTSMPSLFFFFVAEQYNIFPKIEGVVTWSRGALHPLISVYVRTQPCVGIDPPACHFSIQTEWNERRPAASCKTFHSFQTSSTCCGPPQLPSGPRDTRCRCCGRCFNQRFREMTSVVSLSVASLSSICCWRKQKKNFSLLKYSCHHPNCNLTYIFFHKYAFMSIVITIIV